MIEELRTIPLIGWIAIAIILLTQSIWLFRDAQKQGVNPWFWGIWGLTNAPSVAIVYWLVVRRKSKKVKN
jgi:hypothetical protein